MNKKLAVIGGSQFQQLIYINGEYKMNPNYSLYSLPKGLIVNNFSNHYMTSSRALKLVKSMINNEDYNCCILALGEYELDNVDSFKANMEEIIKILAEKKLHVIIVSLPNHVKSNPDSLELQAYLDYLVVENNIDYIYDGKTDKLVTYDVLDREEMRHAILDLCY